MLKITNPTSLDSKIAYLGVAYELEAGESKVVDDGVAIFWKKIHDFLVISDPKQGKKEETGENIVDKKDDEAVADQKITKSSKSESKKDKNIAK